jgi:hypothetical protein
MGWTATRRGARRMPTLALLPILVTASVTALVMWWPRVRSGPGALRLAVELVAAMQIVAAQRLPW